MEPLGVTKDEVRLPGCTWSLVRKVGPVRMREECCCCLLLVGTVETGKDSSDETSMWPGGVWLPAAPADVLLVPPQLSVGGFSWREE